MLHDELMGQELATHQPWRTARTGDEDQVDGGVVVEFTILRGLADPAPLDPCAVEIDGHQTPPERPR
jgi:hypothetical protein